MVTYGKQKKEKMEDPVVSCTSVQLTDRETKLIRSLASEVGEGQSITCLGDGEALEWLVKGLLEGKGYRIYLISRRNSENDRESDAARPDGESSPDPAEGVEAAAVIREYATSTEATRKIKEKIGLLWVNYSDIYADLSKTVQSWQSRLSLNAKVAFHQYDSPASAQVIKDQLGDLGDFKFFKSVDNTLVLTIDECVHHWMIDSREIGICKYCRRKRNFKRIRTGAGVTG
jgi:hypothetical protein